MLLIGGETGRGAGTQSMASISVTAVVRHPARPPYGGVFLKGTAARLDDMNVLRLIACICLSGLVAGCDGAPSRNILGSYFPSWMVCALVGIVVALVARAILKATGLLEELPAPLLVLLALGCAVNFGMWLVWLA